MQQLRPRHVNIQGVTQQGYAWDVPAWTCSWLNLLLETVTSSQFQFPHGAA